MAIMSGSGGDSEVTQRRLRLQLLKGKFVPDGAGGGGTGTGGGAAAPCAVTDEEALAMMSRELPEDILWQMLLFLPAAKLFQLQLVSPEWRHRISSPNFRARIAAAAASQESEDQGVVACAVLADISSSSSQSGRLISSSAVVKVPAPPVPAPRVVDIDLASIVPQWFSEPDSIYPVLVAAGNGLLCFSNCSQHRPECCVLNPLTRTYKVVPKPPFPARVWLPPSAAALTVYSDKADEWTSWSNRDSWDGCWTIATYDLAGSGGWAVTARSSNPVVAGPRPSVVALALCGGEIFYYDGRAVRVLAPAGPGGLVAEVAVLDTPLLASLGLEPGADDDASSVESMDQVAYLGLVERRGVVFCLADLAGAQSQVDGSKVPCGVWRLARDRLAWELVAGLPEKEVQRITGLRHCRVDRMLGASVVRDLLCCSMEVSVVGVRCNHIIVGLNLVTAQWELLHRDWVTKFSVRTKSWPMELRPDVFLS